jgi:hypothetical protein
VTQRSYGGGWFQPVTAVVIMHVAANKHGGNLVVTGSRDTKVKVRRIRG